MVQIKAKPLAVVNIEWLAPGRNRVTLSDGNTFEVASVCGLGWDTRMAAPPYFFYNNRTYRNRIPPAQRAAWAAAHNAYLCPVAPWPAGHAASAPAYVRWMGSAGWSWKEVKMALRTLGWEMDQSDMLWEYRAGQKGKRVIVPPQDIREKLYDAI